MNRMVVLVSSFAALGIVTAAPAVAAIKCENGFQRIQGDLIATPYCQDDYLAQVAREYGFKASAAKIRSNPNYKKDLCRFVFNDIRVQTACLDAGVPEIYRGAP